MERIIKDIDRIGPLFMQFAMLTDEEKEAVILVLKKVVYAARAGMDVQKYNAMSNKFTAYMSTDEMIRRCMPKNVKLFPYKKGASL